MIIPGRRGGTEKWGNKDEYGWAERGKKKKKKKEKCARTGTLNPKP